MAEQVNIKLTGITYLAGDKLNVVIHTQNVEIEGVFWWDALNEFFNKEENINAIEQAAITDGLPANKEFTASFSVELVEDKDAKTESYYIVLWENFPEVDFKITGEYLFSGDEAGYTEEST